MELNNGCLFCDVLKEGARVFFKSRHWFAVHDNFPVNEGHTLIIPRRHCEDLFSLDYNEWFDLLLTIYAMKNLLDKQFNPDGYNIGVNCGQAAGQTVFHLHIHLIPRYKGDVENPRGGIRNFKKALVEY